MARPSLSSTDVCRALFVLSAAWAALSLSNVGCSSGAVCYRNTDCPVGAHCKEGQCVIVVIDPGDAGTAGSQASDAH